MASTPTEVTADLLRSLPLPSHEEDSDKDGRGRIMVVGGSVTVPGAALLSAVGALRAGAGKLQVATVRSAAIGLGLAVPEALVLGLPETEEGGIDPGAADKLLPRADKCDAVVVGPGMTDEAATEALTRALAEGTSHPQLLLDAASLAKARNLAGAFRRRGGRVVLTPHAGEMAGMMDLDREEVSAHPVRTAVAAAAELHAVVALKGGRTIIACPDGRSWSYGGGGIGLATSGSGDTLAGIVAGLMARGAEAVTALVWGVYLHGEAGRHLAKRHGRVGFLARELLAEVPGILDSVDLLHPKGNTPQNIVRD